MKKNEWYFKYEEDDDSFSKYSSVLDEDIIENTEIDKPFLIGLSFVSDKYGKFFVLNSLIIVKYDGKNVVPFQLTTPIIDKIINNEIQIKVEKELFKKFMKKFDINLTYYDQLYEKVMKKYNMDE
jgi:hypothetical protein